MPHKTSQNSHKQSLIIEQEFDEESFVKPAKNDEIIKTDNKVKYIHKKSETIDANILN